MAGAAGLRDVGAVDRRVGVVRGKLTVCGVAVGAGSGDHQTGLDQPLAVDAHDVTADDVGDLRLDPLRSPLPLAMAGTAQIRDVPGIGPRGRQALALGRVFFVAVEALRSIGVARREERTVDAEVVLLHDFCVAGAAVHGFRDRVAGPLVRWGHLRVTLGARRSGMGGDVVRGLVDEQRDHLTVALHLELGIGVTAHAVAVRRPKRGQQLPADLVRLVALDTGRDLVRLLFPQTPLHDLDVHLFDPRVADGAGGSDVVAVDARPRIGVLEDVVRGVARGTDRGDRQPLLEQALAVNRERVVLEDSILGDVVGLRDLGSLVVTAPAEDRNVERRCR